MHAGLQTTLFRSVDGHFVEACLVAQMVRCEFVLLFLGNLYLDKRNGATTQPTEGSLFYASLGTHAMQEP